jgi:hypothetical protein
MPEELEAQELTTNPQTGELELPDHTRSVLVGRKSVGPKRSWKRNAKNAGSYDGKFVYESATIYIQSLGDEEWAELEAREEALTDESDEIARRMESLADDERALRRDRQAARDEGTPTTEFDAALQEVRAGRKELNRRSKGAAKQLTEFQEYVVRLTVVGWKGAPIPYSPEAVGALPLEMVAHWAAVILEKSRVGRSDADFLPPS